MWDSKIGTDSCRSSAAYSSEARVLAQDWNTILRIMTISLRSVSVSGKQTAVSRMQFAQNDSNVGTFEGTPDC